MSLTIIFPFTDEQAKACVIAADRLGVEPWELAVHALHIRRVWREKGAAALTKETSE